MTPDLTEAEQTVLAQDENYLLLATTLDVLRNQLQQAEIDLRVLVEMKEKASSEPVAFVGMLRDKTHPPFPKPQRIVPLPEIDWSQYPAVAPTSFDPAHHTSTRTRTETASSMGADFDYRPSPPAPVPSVASAYPAYMAGVSGPTVGGDGEAAMGRVNTPTSTDDRSQTLNMTWTEEEHTRLLELLELYPSEPIAMRRLEKISAAMGSRTAKQIGTRLQKLAERMKGARGVGAFRKPPTTSSSGRVSGQYYSNRSSTPRYTNSSITLSDDEAGDDTLLGMEVDERLKGSDEYKELVRLQKLMAANQPAAHAADPVHHGYSCDRCAAEPIVGTRWKCTQCPAELQVDLCDDVYRRGLLMMYIPRDHAMQKIVEPEAVDGVEGDPYAYLGL